jgi:hypothetical protein
MDRTYASVNANSFGGGAQDGVVPELRDYEKWHAQYDDPGSDLSERLRVVQGYLNETLDGLEGPVRLLSCCSGDGRDVVGVLWGRADADRVTATLVELHPGIAQRARTAAAGQASGRVEVRTADAGNTDAYIGAVPADVVLLVGVFGNISLADQARTIAAAPQLCRPASTVIWSLGGDHGSRSDELRRLFAEAGFAEIHYRSLSTDTRATIGVARYDGPVRPLTPGQPLFTFLR